MAEQEIYVADVRSNVDKLSAHVIHDTLVNFVRNEALMGEVALKALVPKGETLSLAREAGHSGPYDDGINIEAAVGIPEIHKPGESSPTSAKYPIFVDKGTGIFGETESPIFPKTGEFMKLPPKGDLPIFHRSVKGQEGRHFMADTFSTMIAMMKINGEVFRAELISRMKANQIS